MTKRMTNAQKELANKELNVSRVIKEIKKVKAFGTIVYLVNAGNRVINTSSLTVAVGKLAIAQVNLELLWAARGGNDTWHVEDYRVPKEDWYKLVEAKEYMLRKRLESAGFII